MFEIVIIRAACAVTMAGTFAASATIVNEKSLVPLGLLVAAVTGAVVLTWKVAAILFKGKQENAELKRRIEALENKSNG